MSGALAVPQDRAGWAERIAATWRESVEAIIKTGELLRDAKIALKEKYGHGEFEAMIEKDLPFGRRTAQRLMAVANDKKITKATHGSLLPASWHTLYELTKLDQPTFDAALAKGAIKPDMERKDAAALYTGKRRVERLARAEQIAAREPPPLASIKRRYAVIYADPPWRFETLSDEGKRKSAENHYPTLSAEAIRALPVGDLAASTAALWLWTTTPHLAEAMALIGHWGFHYRSHLIWRKTNATGAPHRGTGFWFINTHELLLLALRGSTSAGLPAPVMGTQAESVIDAPVGRHSEKPERFRGIIESYFPGVAKLELFRRGSAPPGWDVWGNEAEAQLPGEAA